MPAVNHDLLSMHITKESHGFYSILINKEKEECTIKFSPIEKQIKYQDNKPLTAYLKLREFQLRKLLHNKRPDSFYVGFKLNFVLHDGLPNTDFYDRTKITVLDNRNKQFSVDKTNQKTPKIPELFTDGSYNQEKETGGYSILIKTIEGKYLLTQNKTYRKDNNLNELIAVIEGIKYLIKEPKIRIITDSQYVIKGITEWLPLWKLNNFYTANGTKAKNMKEWKLLDKIIENKYLEFEWVKAHSEHFENTICDIKAKSIYSDEKNK